MKEAAITCHENISGEQVEAFSKVTILNILHSMDP